LPRLGGVFYCPEQGYRVGMTVPYIFWQLLLLWYLDIMTIDHHVGIKKDNWIFDRMIGKLSFNDSDMGFDSEY
jgi:hypothetical protein